jgi:hypothetical protein
VIRRLQEVEKEARDLKLHGPGRYALHQARSVELLDAIHTYLKQERCNALPKSLEELLPNRRKELRLPPAS